MAYLALFFAGAFLCNAIPHLVAGLRGEAFPTPFARPRGVGESTPLTNFLWGTANLAAGIALGHVGVPDTIQLAMVAFVAGWLTLGIYLSRHFREVRGTR